MNPEHNLTLLHGQIGMLAALASSEEVTEVLVERDDAPETMLPPLERGYCTNRADRRAYKSGGSRKRKLFRA